MQILNQILILIIGCSRTLLALHGTSLQRRGIPHVVCKCLFLLFLQPVRFVWWDSFKCVLIPIHVSIDTSLSHWLTLGICARVAMFNMTASFACLPGLNQRMQYAASKWLMYFIDFIPLAVNVWRWCDCYQTTTRISSYYFRVTFLCICLLCVRVIITAFPGLPQCIQHVLVRKCLFSCRKPRDFSLMLLFCFTSTYDAYLLFSCDVFVDMFALCLVIFAALSGLPRTYPTCTSM